MQSIQQLRQSPHGGGDRCVEYVPDGVTDVFLDVRRPDVTRRRHGHRFICAEHHRAIYATDRLGEAAAGVLGLWPWVWEAAIPGRRATLRTRGEAMDRQRGQRGRCRNE